jgi:hypothetical protein
MSILWTNDGELRLRRTPGGLWTSHPSDRRPSNCATCAHPLRAALICFILATAILAFAAMAGAEERPAPAAGISWSGPRLAPAEAARIMAQAPGMANAANWPPAWPEGGPAAVVIGGRPGDGPYGALATPRIRPACCDLYVNGWAIPGGRYGSGIRGPILGPVHGANRWRK